MAKITIEGKFGGEDAVLEGEISDVEINQDRAFEEASFYHKDRIFPYDYKTNLKGTLSKYKVTYTKDLVDKVIDRVTIKVERSARVEVADSTIEAIDKVREAIGVPKDAQFVIEPKTNTGGMFYGPNITLKGTNGTITTYAHQGIKDRVPASCIVKFTWTEDV